MFQVKHIMNTQVVCIPLTHSVDEAMQLMVDCHLDTLPVVDEEGKPVGLVTSSALLDFVFHCWPGQPHLSHYMKTPCPIVEKEDPWAKTAEQLRSEKVRTLPVTEKGKVVGTISSEDLLRTMQKARTLVREVLAEQRPENASSWT